jgi:hypothetical protein
VEAVGDALAERMMDEGGGGHGLKYVNVRRAALWGQAQAARDLRMMSFRNELGAALQMLAPGLAADLELFAPIVSRKPPAWGEHYESIDLFQWS